MNRDGQRGRVLRNKDNRSHTRGSRPARQLPGHWRDLFICWGKGGGLRREEQRWHCCWISRSSPKVAEQQGGRGRAARLRTRGANAEAVVARERGRSVGGVGRSCCCGAVEKRTRGCARERNGVGKGQPGAGILAGRLKLSLSRSGWRSWRWEEGSRTLPHQQR